jgi:hypothetical protein
MSSRPHLQVGEKVVAENPIEFPCPFCRRVVMYGKMADTDFSVVTHAWPMCAKFELADGDEFVQACVSELSKTQPN